MNLSFDNVDATMMILDKIILMLFVGPLCASEQLATILQCQFKLTGGISWSAQAQIPREICFQPSFISWQDKLLNHIFIPYNFIFYIFTGQYYLIKSISLWNYLFSWVQPQIAGDVSKQFGSIARGSLMKRNFSSMNMLHILSF